MAVHAHESSALGGLKARFSLYTPPGAGEGGARVPVLLYLAGLTCTEETFPTKAGAQRLAAELGIALVAPDTSPRGANVPGEAESWDFGLAAGFYVDATQEPWSRHYRMWSYVTEELPALLAAEFPALDTSRMGVFGHSMGGHGALICALRRPDLFRSCSAFAPIVAPSQVPWGHKAFGGYLGPDRSAWEAYDACALLRAGHRAAPILVDQGEADKFLAEQLRPELLREAALAASQDLTLRLHPGYDHSYWFIQSFVEDHLRHHARALLG